MSIGTPQSWQAHNLAEAIKSAKSNIDPRINPRELDVVVATPSLSHSVSLHYLMSMLETVKHVEAYGARFEFVCRGGDAFVAKVRNKLVTQFLQDFPTINNFFFIDDDVGWQGQSHKFIEFLMRPDDVVAGIYPKKSKELDFPVNITADLDRGELMQSQGMYAAMMAPTGFMRIKRRVLEKLAETASQFTDAEKDNKFGIYYNIFETGRGPTGEWWGEDYVFCHKCTSAGFSIWVDPAIKFHHQGLNNWEGILAENLPILEKKAAKAGQEYRKRKRAEEREINRNNR